MIAASGNEALLLLAIDHELVSPCFSAEILQEYEQVLRRPKFGFEALEMESLLNLIRRQGEFIHSAPIPPLSPDPGDDKFIACALAAKSEFWSQETNDTIRNLGCLARNWSTRES